MSIRSPFLWSLVDLSGQGAIKRTSCWDRRDSVWPVEHENEGRSVHWWLDPYRFENFTESWKANLGNLWSIHDDQGSAIVLKIRFRNLLWVRQGGRYFRLSRIQHAKRSGLAKEIHTWPCEAPRSSKENALWSMEMGNVMGSLWSTNTLPWKKFAGQVGRPHQRLFLLRPCKIWTRKRKDANRRSSCLTFVTFRSATRLRDDNIRLPFSPGR